MVFLDPQLLLIKALPLHPKSADNNLMLKHVLNRLVVTIMQHPLVHPPLVVPPPTPLMMPLQMLVPQAITMAKHALVPVSSAPQVPPVNPEMTVKLVATETPAKTVTPDKMLPHLLKLNPVFVNVLPAHLDLPDLPVTKAPRDTRVMLDLLVLLASPDPKVPKANKVLPDLPVFKDVLVKRVS